jgi:hypothetical protein
MKIRILLSIVAVLFFLASVYFYNEYVFLCKLAGYYGVLEAARSNINFTLAATILNFLAGLILVAIVCVSWIKNKRAARNYAAPEPPSPPTFD